jgi:hypothetical protein
LDNITVVIIGFEGFGKAVEEKRRVVGNVDWGKEGSYETQ